jgi:hypothetical protein
MASEKAIFWIIALVFFVLMLVWSPSLWGSIKDSWEKIKPEVGFGAPEVAGGKPTLPVEQEKALNRMQETIQYMLNSSKNNCFANYDLRFPFPSGNGLPPLGEEGTSITFRYRPDKQPEGTEMIVTSGAGGSQEVSYRFFPTMRPCVVAWGYASDAQSAPTNFYYQFLNLNPLVGTVSGSYYVHSDLITIKYDTGKTFLATNENRIAYEKENRKLYDFQDGGYLFKGEEGDICFFPTTIGNVIKSSCDGDDSDGLDNDCFISPDKIINSVLGLLNDKALSWC